MWVSLYHHEYKCETDRQTDKWTDAQTDARTDAMQSGLSPPGQVFLACVSREALMATFWGMQGFTKERLRTLGMSESPGSGS